MRRKRGGFTLVEMLVSIALVMLMMAIFAQAFGVAAGAFKTSRGLAQNSQRARTLTTILQNDLDNRTFKVIVPFDDNETDPGAGLRDFANRRGYLYISENSLNDGADDVLQLTIELPDGEVMYGKSGQLGDINADTNQPDYDDGDPDNSTLVSKSAEVAYFVRGGVLYRRVLLLRKPLDPLTMSLEPRDAGGVALIDTEYDSEDITGSQQGDFWNDFDLSAANDSFVGTGFRLNGTAGGFDSLDNNTPGFALGKPRMRFGFCNATGQPREYVNSVSPVEFYIGRFTHQETSHSAFSYPGDSASDPTNQATVLAFNGKDHVVSNFSGGSRRAEDILMTNVYSFDVKVWDSIVKQFVDIGFARPPVEPDPPPALGVGEDGNTTNDTFGADNNAHVAASIIYGPTNAPSENRVFDTWFPAFDVDNTMGDDTTAPDTPPFRPLNFGTDGQPGVAGVDDDASGTTDDASEFGWPGTDDKPSVTAIQITVRYHDRPSDQVKQLTLVQSLWPMRP